MTETTRPGLRRYRYDPRSLVMPTHKLDHIDLRILRTLQENGRMPNATLAVAVGLTPPPTLRRTKTLEDAGYIQNYRATLSPELLGFTLTAFVSVGLSSQTAQDIERFALEARSWETVRECHAISGGSNFLLKCLARDLDSFQSFVLSTLMTASHVETVRTSIVLNIIKNEVGVPPTLATANIPLAAARKGKTVLRGL